MKEPSLQRLTAFSFVLHISALLIAFLILRQSNQFIMPSAYTVSLISPEVLKGKETRKTPKTLQTLKKPSVIEDIPKKNKKTTIEKKRETKKNEERVEERIAAIEAKKRVERIVRLRSMISLSARGNNQMDISEATPVPTGKGTIFDEYYAKIRREIWQQWVFPDTGQKNLEAIISIRIGKNGTITAQKIEKSSGNPLFDRSAIRALTKASPLSPPPYEMEIGVRFYP